MLPASVSAVLLTKLNRTKHVFHSLTGNLQLFSPDIDITAKDKEGLTPLSQVLASGIVELTQILAAALPRTGYLRSIWRRLRKVWKSKTFSSSRMA